MENKSIGLRIGIILIGTLNVLTGLFFMPFLLLWGVIIFITGILYFVFGIAILFRRLYSKLLFYGVVPFTGLYFIDLRIMSMDQDASNYNRMTFDIYLGWILPLFFICIINTYCFTRPRIKEYFESKNKS